MKVLEILKRMFAIDEYPSKPKMHTPVKENVPVEQKQEGKFYKDFLKQIYVCKVPYTIRSEELPKANCSSNPRTVGFLGKSTTKVY